MKKIHQFPIYIPFEPVIESSHKMLRPRFKHKYQENKYSDLTLDKGTEQRFQQLLKRERELSEQRFKRQGELFEQQMEQLLKQIQQRLEQQVLRQGER
jgi:DNA gyrase/topoisomerase IV subunit B